MAIAGGDEGRWSPRGAGRRALTQIAGVLAAALAVADLIRWANRWYVSTMFSRTPDAAGASAELLARAHEALVHALIYAVLAAIAATIGWRLRIVRGSATGRPVG